MNEQRQQAYLKLLQSLENRPSGEALELLAANQDLVNTEFVETMATFAKELLGNGSCNTVESLIPFTCKLTEIHFAFKIVEEKGFSSSTPIVSPPPALAYRLPFILQMLMVTTESDGNAEAVYPLLKANLDKLDDITALVLHSWATIMLMMAQPEEARGIASHIVKMSDLIVKFPLGARADNLEIAIAGYKVAFIVYKREISPHDWGQIQNNLGIAYGERIKGKRFENLEEAIACHKAALNIFNKETSPVDWAIANTNLAKAYIERIKGEQARNVEEAIDFCQNALQVYKRELFPKEWAGIQHNLGSIYYDKIQGERTQNLEKALVYYRAALEVRTCEEFPQDWAMTQINLGTVYRDRVNGERAENLEESIACYKAALQVYYREAFPQQWAMAQSNLGSAYMFRIRGERVQNQEDAITCYRAALEVFNCEAFPQYWAMTQNNLGIVYWERIQGERTKNLEEAIACCEASLEVCTREAFPLNWAMTQHNLGIAYHARIEGERSQNQEKAISCYLAALKVRTREAFPQYWAMTQHNLGIAYSDRILGEWTENLGKAITCFLAALEVRTCKAFPINHAETQFHLGKAYQDARLFTQAHNAFKSAIDTVESLREEIIVGSGMELDKQKLAEKYNQMYQSIVEVSLEIAKEEPQYNELALEYIERSKARNLTELLTTRDLYPEGNISETILQELDILRREIAAEQRHFDQNQMLNQHKVEIEKQNLTLTTSQNSARLNVLRSKLDNLIKEQIQPIDPTFSLTQRVETINYQQIRDLLPNEQTALIQWYITSNTFITAIITYKSTSPCIWQSTPENLQSLRSWVNEYFKDYSQQKDQWRDRLESRLKELVKILHLDDIFSHPELENCTRLILIPHRFLHLLPLHALEVRAKKAKGEIEQNVCTHKIPNLKSNCLLDLFPDGVSYAPSSQLLQLTKNQQHPKLERLFAVQNPTGDLDYTDIEVAFIRQQFHPYDRVLVKDAAKKANFDPHDLEDANVVHFSCHGYFNFFEPLKSALVLADAVKENSKLVELQQCLTLGEIFALKLNKCGLVTLSACETGLTDFNNVSDEYISLPSGFLYAGSSNVVTSLWTVNDLSTALLMMKFYENLKKGIPVLLALNNAQIWLRDSTQAELLKNSQKLPLDEVLKQSINESLNWFNADEQPFAEPEYWAAFCIVGG